MQVLEEQITIGASGRTPRYRTGEAGGRCFQHDSDALVSQTTLREAAASLEAIVRKTVGRRG